MKALLSLYLGMLVGTIVFVITGAINFIPGMKYGIVGIFLGAFVGYITREREGDAL